MTIGHNIKTIIMFLFSVDKQREHSSSQQATQIKRARWSKQTIATWGACFAQLFLASY